MMSEFTDFEIIVMVELGFVIGIQWLIALILVDWRRNKMSD